jgi:long-chain acyl-CoA synthetase
MRLFNNFNKFKNFIAISNDEEDLSYQDLQSRLVVFKKIINRKSLLILVSSNTIISIIFYIFAIKHDCKIIILDENHSENFIKKTILKFKPNFIFFPKIKKILKNKKKVIIQDYALCEIHKIIDKKINKKNSIILTTSGTTSNPKFVRLSPENIYENTHQIQKYLKINYKHKTITTLPMAYSYGLSIINTHLEFGGQVYLSNFSPVNINFWKIIKKKRINNFGSIPAMYEFLKKIKFEKLISSDIKYLTVAGGKTNNETLKYLRLVCLKKNINFFVMYGQTEASPRISFIDITKNLEFKSIGKPVNGGKIELINNEIVYTGKNVSLGYAKNLNDLYLGDVNKGKLFTGDLGVKDDKGYFYITGRKKRISKLFGLRINLDDIQNYLEGEGYQIYLNINDNKIDITYNQKYNDKKIKELISQKYNINKNYISCVYSNKIKKNIFK